MKITKHQANYRPAEDDDFTCGNCIHFLPANEAESYGFCGLVQGRISAEAVCDFWEPNPSMEPGDIVYELEQAVKERANA